MAGALNQKGIRPPIITDCIDITGRTQLNATYNATANSIASMAEGIYDIWSTTDCYIAVSQNATVANAVAANTGYLLRTGNTIPIKIRAGDNLGVVQSTANGTLAAVQVG